MVSRIAALLMVLLFAGHALAGGIVCGIDALSTGFERASELSCSMQGEDSAEEMACCLLGKSPTGSVVAMACCEIKCGESTSGALFNFTPQTPAIAPSFTAIRIVSLDALSEAASSTTTVSVRSAERRLLHHDPPDLFLSNSTFLI